MIVCKGCGHQNEDDARFCRQCGSFLEWTGHKRAEQQSSALTLELTPTDISIEPGAEASCEVRVRNSGTLADEFVIEVTGQAAEWTAVEPATLRLLPGTEEVAKLTLRPPRSPMVRAGKTAFAVRVRSSMSDDQPASEKTGTATVGAFTALETTIAPQTVEALDTAEFTLMVRNEGNARAEVRLHGFDADGRLSLEVEPEAHGIEPGGSAASRVRVSRRPGVSRPGKRFPFEVRVELAGAESSSIAAALEQQRPLEGAAARRRWGIWPIAMAAVAVLLVATGIGAFAAANSGISLFGSGSSLPPVTLPSGLSVAATASATPSATPTATPTASPGGGSRPPQGAAGPQTTTPAATVATWQVMPTRLDWTLKAGDTPTSMRVRVRNTGTVGTLVLASFRTGPNPAFGTSTSSSCFEGQKLGPGELCEISVVFFPPAPVTSQSQFKSTLIVTDGNGKSAVVDLQGSWQPASSPPPSTSRRG